VASLLIFGELLISSNRKYLPFLGSVTGFHAKISSVKTSEIAGIQAI
jgi:hypothetical protein